MRWCIPSRSTVTSPSPWKGWIYGLSWPRSVSPRSPPMIYCQSSAIMAQQAVSPSCDCVAEGSENKRSMSKAEACSRAGQQLFWESLSFICTLNFSCAVFPVTGGHYIAYCQNVINGQWYEFDDQYVTEVHETVVQNAEAYVLFYRWAVPCMQRFCPGCRVLRNEYGKLRVEELLHFSLPFPTEGKAVKRLCESVRKLCPLPAWRSTVYSSSTSLESGSTNSTPLLSLVPSPITPFCALMEVRQCCWTQKSNFQLCLLVFWCFNKCRKKSSSCSPVTVLAVVGSASLAKASAHSGRDETVAPLSCWSEAQRNA